MSSKKPLRKNEEITVPKIRVVDEDDNQLGVMGVEEALHIARERQLDLVEVSPKAEPPVCRIMDFGHYLYRQKKVENKQKRLAKAHETKEIRFGIRISDHDFQVRVVRARQFLEKQHSVKIILQFRGREASHPEIGLKRIEEMKISLADVAKCDEDPKKQGRNIIVELKPSAHQKSE